eukprot:1379910-Prymnesium_polylepis.1
MVRDRHWRVEAHERETDAGARRHERGATHNRRRKSVHEAQAHTTRRGQPRSGGKRFRRQSGQRQAIFEAVVAATLVAPLLTVLVVALLTVLLRGECLSLLLLTPLVHRHALLQLSRQFVNWRRHKPAVQQRRKRPLQPERLSGRAVADAEHRLARPSLQLNLACDAKVDPHHALQHHLAPTAPAR